MKGLGLKAPPSQVQLPGGIILKGLAFKILDYHEDGSPKTFEILPRGVAPTPDNAACVLYANEAWIRSSVKKP